jgi:hypothetical protein
LQGRGRRVLDRGLRVWGASGENSVVPDRSTDHNPVENRAWISVLRNLQWCRQESTRHSARSPRIAAAFAYAILEADKKA